MLLSYSRDPTPGILWDTKFIFMSITAFPLLVPVLSQMNPVHTIAPFFLELYFNDISIYA